MKKTRTCCPFCGSLDIYKRKGKFSGLTGYKCKRPECREEFTIPATRKVESPQQRVPKYLRGITK